MLNACEPYVYIHNGAAVYAGDPCVSTPAYVSLARVYTFALRQDHGCGRVCAVADACYGDEVRLSSLRTVVGIMTKRMLQ